MGSTQTFKMPPDDNFSDLLSLNELLNQPKFKSDPFFARRRQEVEVSLKQIVQTKNDNLTELNKYPKFKLNPTEYVKKKEIETSVNNLYVRYYGEMISTKEKVRITVLNESTKFKRIFTILRTVRHPNVEKFIGASITPEATEFVTKYSGVTLENFLPMNNDDDEDEELVFCESGDVTKIAFNIAHTMAYLHSRGIIHRSLSISNIFITKDEKDEPIPIIGDLINSRILSSSSMLGMTNIVDDSFVAPELSNSSTYDEKVDVFAFSGILYTLLYNKKPFEEEISEGLNIKDMVINGERPVLDDECPENLKDLIEKCWDQDPEKRYTFQNIVDEMIKKKIIFPCDKDFEDSISEFYDQFQIKDNDAKQCLVNIKAIFDEIEKAVQFRYELIQCCRVLSNYSYTLRNSDYVKKEILPKDKKVFKEMNNNLKDLMKASNFATEEVLFNEFFFYEANYVSDQISSLMDNIYNSMIKLGFNDIDKYEVNDNDLVFDYIELSSLVSYIEDNVQTLFQQSDYFNAYQNISKKNKEIENFLTRKNLFKERSQQVIISQIKDLSAQFRKYERKMSEFEYYNALGSGSQSIVYKGKDNKTQRDVAIKVFNENYLSNGFIPLKFLQREIRSLVHLKHEYITEFIGFCISDTKVEVWLVFEYVPNGSLYEKVHDLLPLEKTKIAFDIALAMEYVHSKNFIHRDLKTLNILLDETVPKITDFGYSRSYISGISATNRIGTYNYMAPEVIDSKGQYYGTPADVYSFAMILWELNDEACPYIELSDDEIIRVRLNGSKINFKNPILDGLKNLIIDCQNKNPSERPSFSTIVDRMINENIMFVSQDSYNEEKDTIKDDNDLVEDVKKFYKDESEKRSRSNH